MKAVTNLDDLFQKIPDPNEVRDRLGQALREASLLRRLLKISEAAAKERRTTGEGHQHGQAQ